MLGLGLLLFVGIGMALGAIGSGGSILALPVFVYVLGISPAAAVPMSMVIVGAASAGATLLKWRQGDVHWQALALVASTGAAGAFLGSKLTYLVPQPLLMTFFGAILLVVGVFVFGDSAARRPAAHCQRSRCLTVGGLIGVLTGFLGVGGGFLLVPSLMLFGGLELRQALGTSVGVITINSLAGILGHLGTANIDWRLSGLLIATSIPGVVLGVYIAKRLPARMLRRALASVMIAIGVIVAWLNVPAAF